MLDMVFPSISGYNDVKTCLLCLLANQWDGKNRERLHILLYGKPGCGKTALMEPLEKNWGAIYLSMDPSGASLKGDSRKEDNGAKILNQADGRVVCIDDIELMKEMNVIRDVMERGSYTITKNGKHVEYDARCRFVAATNDIKKMPFPIVSRFDLVFNFSYPTIQQSIDILHSLLEDEEEDINNEALINHYFYLVQTHTPHVTNKAEVESIVRDNLEEFGADTGEGKEGRWMAGILRLAKANARIHLGDVGPEQIEWALMMKRNSDKVLKSIL